MVHYKKLNNGIRLIVKQMPGLMSVSMGRHILTDIFPCEAAYVFTAAENIPAIAALAVESCLAYTVYSYVSPYIETGSLVVYAGVNSGNYLKSVQAVYDCIKDIKSKNISKEEFMRGKEQMTGSNPRNFSLINRGACPRCRPLRRQVRFHRS